jgi:hypothetical protein
MARSNSRSAVGFVFVFLVGCASIQGDRSVRVSIAELTLPELVEVCNRGVMESEPDLMGCYRWSGNVCLIYTLPKWTLDQRKEYASGYHETLGHELRHCLEGSFHGGDRGVDLPRLPKLR